MTKCRYALAMLVMLITLRCLAQEHHPNVEFAQETPIKTDTLSQMITCTMLQEALKSGTGILDQGGSAMDAALSVALSQITITGGKYVSFAGMFNMLYYEASTGRVYNLNASFNAPEGENDPATIPLNNYDSNLNYSPTNGRTVLVPGFMKGVEEAHKRFGKLPFEKIFAHSIDLATNGVEWTARDSRAVSRSKHILAKYPETRAIFIKHDGPLYNQGDIFKQPWLAETLRSVAAKGADYMYTGPWAKRFVKTVRDAGGKIALKDLKRYKAIWSEPVRGTYNGYEIYTHGEPAIGGTLLLEKLNLAEVAQVSKNGPYWESPRALYLLYLVATSANDKYLSFDSTIISKAHAKEKWDKIVRSAAVEDQPRQNKPEHSSSVIATDRWGNMVAIIHSINTVDWGSNGLFVGGVSIPDAASYHRAKISTVGPGGRIPEETCPGLVFKDGLPVLAFSCVGRGLVNQSLASLVATLDFNFLPEETFKIPSIGSSNNRVLFIRPQFKKTVKDGAQELGATFIEHTSVIEVFWSAILRNYRTGSISSTKIAD